MKEGKQVLSKIEFNEIHEAQEIYNQATLYARTVGHIDWEYPFPAQAIEDYWEQNELYCVRGELEQLVAVMRLSTEANPQIWQDNARALYVGKMAVGHEARGTATVTNIIAPAIYEIAVESGLSEIRFDCLAYNERLRRFYNRISTEQAEVDIVSRNGNSISVVRFSSEVIYG